MRWSSLVSKSSRIGVLVTASTLSLAIALPASAAGVPTWSTTALPWTLPTAGSISVSAVSCVSATACTAVGPSNSGGSDVETLLGGVWTTSTVPSFGSLDFGLTSIQCSTASTCLAIGANETGGYAAALAGGVWHETQITSDAFGMNTLSCATATSCLAIGNGNQADLLKGSTWSTITVPGPATLSSQNLEDVSCPSTTACYALGTGSDSKKKLHAYVVTLNGSSTSAAILPAVTGITPSGPADISCPGVGSCVVTYTGVNATKAYKTLAVQLAAGAWTSTTLPALSNNAAYYFDSVSCASTTHCIAVGTTIANSGSVAVSGVEDHGTWTVNALLTPPTPSGDLTVGSVSCPSITSCVTVGNYSDSQGQTQSAIWTLAAGAWTNYLPSIEGPPAAFVRVVSCPSPGSCISVGREADTAGTHVFIETLKAGRWTPTTLTVPTGLTLSPAAIACTSTTSCTVVGVGNALLTLTGSAWSFTKIPGAPVLLTSLSCPVAGHCVAGGFSNSISTITGTTVSSTKVAGLASGGVVTGLSCAVLGSCSLTFRTIDSKGNPHTTIATLKASKWSTVSVASTLGSVYLSSISCPTASSCVASGFYGDARNVSHAATATLVGTKWVVSAIALPIGTIESQAGPISCNAPGSCTALGLTADATNVTAYVSFTLSGGSWVTASIPDAAGTGSTYLGNLSCATATTCVTVGEYAPNSGGAVPLVSQMS